jgi:hypothetical protein
MRLLTALVAGLLGLSFLAAGGCQRLNYETTVQVAPSEIEVRTIDPPRREQKVTVTFQSSGPPVDVYVTLEGDREAAKDALLNGKKPASSLGGSAKVTDGTLQVTVPAKSGYSVLIMNRGNQNADVKLTIKGR